MAERSPAETLLDAAAVHPWQVVEVEQPVVSLQRLGKRAAKGVSPECSLSPRGRLAVELQPVPTGQTVPTRRALRVQGKVETAADRQTVQTQPVETVAMAVSLVVVELVAAE